MLFATEGRCADTVARFAADLAEHGGDPATVTDTSSDMSTAFISGIRAHLPNATMTFDRFHLAAKLSEAIDAVRRDEVATRPELKHTRWLWLKNLANLSAKQTARAPRADAPLEPSSRPRGRCGGGRTSRPSTTKTPATPRRTCAAGAPARNAPASTPSKTSSPWWRNTGTASSPGTKTT